MAALRPGAEPEPDDDLDDEEIDTEIETEQGEEPEQETETEEQPGETETGEEPEAEDPESEPTSARSTSRGNRQFGEMRRELRETKRQLEELKRRPNTPDPAALAAQQQREREDDERVMLSGDAGAIAQHFAAKAERRIEQRLNQVAFHSADAADRTTFQTLVNGNPVYAGVADEVEDRLAQARAAGMNPQRIAIAHLIMGERVAKRAKPALTRQRRQAEVTNSRQAARPGSSRSDVSTGRRASGDTHAKRGDRLDQSGLL